MVHEPRAGLRLAIAICKASTTISGSQVCGHRPADHTTTAGIENEGQVDEALRGANVGYVRYPQPIRFSRDEVPFDQVRSGLLERRAWGGPHPPSPHAPPKPRPRHEPGDSLSGAVDAYGPELGVYPGRSVGRPAVAVDRLDLLGERRVERALSDVGLLLQA